jgi:hypothetical protein
MPEYVKWLKWRAPTTIEQVTHKPEKTAATPHHKPQQQQRQQQQQQANSPQLELSLDPHLKPVADTAADIKKYQTENSNESYTEPFERMLQPHIGMNPFLNGNTYLNDIVVQNTMLRGEGGRV